MVKNIIAKIFFIVLSFLSFFYTKSTELEVKAILNIESQTLSYNGKIYVYKLSNYINDSAIKTQKEIMSPTSEGIYLILNHS